MDSLWQDLRYGLRGLRNQPGFTALAVLTLALGIGATTMMFSVIYNVLLDPFPYRDADRVVMMQIRAETGTQSGGRTFFQTPEFLDYQTQTHVFDEVIASGYETNLYTTREGTEELFAALTSDNMFRFLGVPAVVGRTLTPADAEAGAPPVFVMSYKMWLKYFNLDPGIVGQTFALNGVQTTLVGIMPKRFTKLAADLYKPVVLDRADPRVSKNYFMFQATLKPGVTIQKAEAELNVIAQRLAKVYPRNYPSKFTVRLVSWVDNVVGGFKRTLYTLAAAVGLLLLIACANVANFLLARAASREKEMAVRAALGASRARLVRQLLVESLLLALLGAAAGCLFSYAGLKVLVAMIPDGAIPREADIRLSLPVLLLSLGVSALTAVLFGLVPALQSARPDPVESLKDSSKGGGGGFRRGKYRRALVVAEVALSLVLLAGAGLLMRSFVKLLVVELGFQPGRVLFARLTLPEHPYETAAAKHQFFRQLLPRVQALPGVASVTVASSLPAFWGTSNVIDIPGKTHKETWNATVEVCSEDYGRTLGLRVLRGRFLSEVEVSDARKSVVVNQALVNRYFGGEDPIGRSIKFPRFAARPGAQESDALFEIVGVVADVKNRGVGNPADPATYLPHSATADFRRALLVRTNGDPLALVNTVRREIWSQDRSVAVTEADSITNYLRDYAYAQPRFTLLVLGAFAAVGLVLVALGVYSVIAYTVSQRTHEFGIRMALGATRTDLLRLVVGMGLRLIGLGIIVGGLLSLAVTRVLVSELREVSPQDPLTFTGVTVIVALVGLAACYFPARRATRVDPMVALRHE